MRGVGDTITPLFALIVSTIVGLLVTPALIDGWFGLPQLGVASAAVGFVASFVVTLRVARASTCAARAMRWRPTPSS